MLTNSASRSRAHNDLDSRLGKALSALVRMALQRERLECSIEMALAEFELSGVPRASLESSIKRAILEQRGGKVPRGLIELLEDIEAGKRAGQ